MTAESFILKKKKKIEQLKCPLRKMPGEIHHCNGIDMHQELPADCPKKTEPIF